MIANKEENKESVPLPFKGTSNNLHTALPLLLKFSHMATTNRKSDSQEYYLLVGYQCTQLRIRALTMKKKGKMGNWGN